MVFSPSAPIKFPPVLFGEVLFDCFADGTQVLGGAPFNVSWHLQGFGAEPLLISRVGTDDLGESVQAIMTQWGMTTLGVQRDPSYPTGNVQITLQAGQPTFEILADQAYDHIQADELPIVTPALIYHGSLALRSPTSAAALQTLLQKNAAPVFVDINLRSPWWQLSQLVSILEQARWLKINDTELDLVIDGKTQDITDKAKHLQQQYQLHWVIVTQGASGAFILDEAGAVHRAQLTEKVAVVDTVGAGDAFASVCVLGILNQWPIQATLGRSQQLASLVVRQRGAIIEAPSVYRGLQAAWSSN